MGYRDPGQFSGKSKGQLVFGIPEVFIYFGVIFVEFFVGLTAIGLLTQNVTIANLNYLGISVAYSILPMAGISFIFILAFVGGARFVKQIEPLHFALITPIVLGITLMFAITSVVSLISTSSLFLLYKFIYQSTDLSAFITNPVFYLSWIASNAIGEEMVLLPPFIIAMFYFGSKIYTRVIINITLGFVFVIFHVVKELLIYGSITIGAEEFFVAAFFVRIMLNELTWWTRVTGSISMIPAFFAHSGFDVFGSVYFGAS